MSGIGIGMKGPHYLIGFSGFCNSLVNNHNCLILLQVGESQNRN